MPLSRGLMISLGVSALGCTLLFLYFRHRMTTIENKVNVMFDLIQNHQPGPEQQPEQYYSQKNTIKIRKGEVIALSGNSGGSSGAHAIVFNLILCLF